MTQPNPLLCDPDLGFCEMPDTSHLAGTETAVVPKPGRIIYFTDPICSSCWGIEPQLRRLKLEYGASLEIDYRMGGLLPDWNYNSGGISKPSDVAHHWDEVSRHYQMPIDGDVWLEDPLHSSYPPSIAFKAAQLQSTALAVIFLRRVREMVFLEKKNITKWEHLSEAASYAELDTARFKQDYESVAGQNFNDDLALARHYGVRGFPTLFFVSSQANEETVYGVKPYEAYENAIRTILPGIGKQTYDRGWESLFGIFKTLTTREFAELSGHPVTESEEILIKLNREQLLIKFETKNGSLWKR